MNLQENIRRIKVLIEQTTPQTKKIFVDMGGVLFKHGSNDEAKKENDERPRDIKGFQSWVINTKNDKEILGKYGDDGKWGAKTSDAWIKYGEEYKQSLPNSTTQTDFIGKDLWNGLQQYKNNITILSALGSGTSEEQEEKIKNKTNQIINNLGLTGDKLETVTKGTDKANITDVKGNILIDDSPENITAWVNAGGIGILHKNDNETIKQLSQYV